jgi:prevent-host-death family protein
MEVGVLEGRNRFSQLVEAAERGETTVVMKRGKPVAKLVPFGAEVSPDIVEQRRRAIERARALGAEITARNGRQFTHEELMDAKNEGRR